MPGPNFVAGHSNAVTGAAEFARDLRQMDSNLAKEFGKAGREIGKVVVTEQKSNASQYSRQAAAAAKAISIASTNTFSQHGGISLLLRSSRVAFALGAEFGAKRWPQFPPWKGNQWSGMPEGIGYWWHPAIMEKQEEVLDLYMKAVDDAGRRAGIDVSNGPRQATTLDIAAGQLSQVKTPTFVV